MRILLLVLLCCSSMIAQTKQDKNYVAPLKGTAEIVIDVMNSLNISNVSTVTPQISAVITPKVYMSTYRNPMELEQLRMTASLNPFLTTNKTTVNRRLSELEAIIQLR